MKELNELIDRIADRVNVNLREPSFDAGPYIRGFISPEKFYRFYAFYGLTPDHPLRFHFRNSSLAGSYFLGKCFVEHSVLYKSDIRGDELKSRGDIFSYDGMKIPLHDDEIVLIRDSFLLKTLVHSHSNDPESPEEYQIQNTISMHYANIHGSPVEGSFLGPFSTVDLTTLHDCVIGAYAYVQVRELSHHQIEPGQVWIHVDGAFEFSYQFAKDVLDRYIRHIPGKAPEGVFMEFAENLKGEFQQVFDKVRAKPPIPVPVGAFLSNYAVVVGNSRIAENVLVAQRAYLENAWLGKGSNVQENCYIVHSTLDGNDVTAHGSKIVHSRLGKKVFVGFNSFLRGSSDFPLMIGEGCIVMPHTIVDLEESLEIPPGHIIWGHIQSRGDLEEQCLSLEDFSKIEKGTHIGRMRFQGSGEHFVNSIRHRIEHILEANGAFFDPATGANRGHAQKTQFITFNTIQPYSEGERQGLYPSIDIRP
jgi:carbonic anhydrase/acetyltransferase-like protein (isoleucine patch superfamily)